MHSWRTSLPSPQSGENLRTHRMAYSCHCAPPSADLLAAQHVCSFRRCPRFVKFTQLFTIREASLVDIALRLNVLAVFAAILFVSAIVLGAF
jgi:hypothetical protein